MAQCLFPVFLEKRDVFFPCGKCPPCRQRRASSWSFRLMYEDRIANSSFFLTLTYSNDKVPLTSSSFMDLRKSHLQSFFKALRYSQVGRGTSGIKYYAVGEYGGRFKRPHYHVILFNADLSKLIGESASKAFYRNQIKLDGKQHFDCPSWARGHITVGLISLASVGYTLKYISKPRWRPMHKNDDRSPEFSLMSKRLGANYLSFNMINWHKNDLKNRMYVNIAGGFKASMPRYYKDKIYSLQDRAIVSEFQASKMKQQQKIVYDGNRDKREFNKSVVRANKERSKDNKNF